MKSQAMTGNHRSWDDPRLYIDGRWQDRKSAPQIPVVDPYSEGIVGHVAAGSPADVDLAVAAARSGRNCSCRPS